MKKIPLLFIVLFLACINLASAQLSKCNAEFIEACGEKKNHSRTYTILVQGNIQDIIGLQEHFKIKVNYSYGNIASVTGELCNLLAFAKSGFVKRIELHGNRHLRMMNDTMRKRNVVNPVHNGQAPLSKAYTGKGVLFGFIDTGIDYTHPDFKDSTGKSRILYIWDQNFSVAANTPSPFGYGQEWDSSAFNNNTCPHNDVAGAGHGTHTAGIGAGNGGFKKVHVGVAPDASIIMVAVNSTSSNAVIADAVAYIFKKADSLGMPCVINISVGDYYGSHDGLDLEAQLVDSMLQETGRIVVAPAGNAGNIKYHLGYVVNSDTNFTWLSNTGTQLSFQIYSNSFEFTGVKYSIGANENANFSDRGNIGFKNFAYAIGALEFDTIYRSGNRIGIVQSVADTFNGVYKLNVVVFKDSANYLWRFETTGSGIFHAWNFDFVSTGLPSNAIYPKMDYYKPPDTVMTLLSGFPCSDKVITVGNYTNLSAWYDVNNNFQTWPNQQGAIAPSSSQGPTRDGRIKPEICATGDQIFSAAVLTLIPSYLSSSPDKLSQDSLHILGGGSSAASAVVAGAAALFLEMDSMATGTLYRQQITGCQQLDNFTGTTGLPNNLWGYGKLDAYMPMFCVPVTIKPVTSESAILVYPNPGSTTIMFDLHNSEIGFYVEIFDFLGKKIAEKPQCKKNCSIDISELSKGVYFYRVIDVNGNLSSGKLVRH